MTLVLVRFCGTRPACPLACPSLGALWWGLWRTWGSRESALRVAHRGPLQPARQKQRRGWEGVRATHCPLAPQSWSRTHASRSSPYVPEMAPHEGTSAGEH
jgi:hypothetical protein